MIKNTLPKEKKVSVFNNGRTSVSDKNITMISCDNMLAKGAEGFNVTAKPGRYVVIVDVPEISTTTGNADSVSKWLSLADNAKPAIAVNEKGEPVCLSVSVYTTNLTPKDASTLPVKAAAVVQAEETEVITSF